MIVTCCCTSELNMFLKILEGNYPAAPTGCGPA